MTVDVGVPIVKLHGAHNAFVLIDERPPRLSDFAAIARALCSLEGGLGGADGLLVVKDAPGFDAEMQIFNADGSTAEMCGNGIRCVAKYLAERGAQDAFVIKTLAGPIGVSIRSREPFEARVDMGAVGFPHALEAETAAGPGGPWTFYDVSVGNPHAVMFVEDVNRVDVVTIGRLMNWLERFPNGTNVHAVQVLDRATLKVRHYERGVGETEACGTGAVACAAAALGLGKTQGPVLVQVKGGDLRVEWTAGTNAFLTGPAETMFERTIVL